VVDETGREGSKAHRAERMLSERDGRYWASGDARGAGKFCVVSNCCAHFILLTHNALPSSFPSFDVVDEIGREGSKAHRAERTLSVRDGRYRASGSARGVGKSCVVSNRCAHFMLLTRKSLLSSLPSFDVVNETDWEDMVHRAKRYQAAGGSGRYRASGGAQGTGKFCCS